MTSHTRDGPVIVIAGPDGTGKSTVVAHLVAVLPAPVLALHHRPGLLPARHGNPGRAPITDPHATLAYPMAASIAKVVYLFVDYHLGWKLRVQPHLRRGGSVILERGWWDLAVDPLRYRLRGVGWLVRRLGRAIPRSDVTIVLVGTAETLLARKAEISADELRRQVAEWQQLDTGAAKAVVDTGQPLPGVLKEVVRACREVAARD